MPSKWRVHSCLRKNLLTILTVTGVFAGVALGIFLKESNKGEWNPRDISYVKFVGDLFLSILKGLILPLAIFSLVAAVGSLDLSLSKKIGVGGIIFFAFTTLSAIILGIILALAIRPGLSREMSWQGQSDTDPTTVQDTLMDLIRNMFPPNLVQATLEHYRTKLILPAGKFGNSTPSLRDYEMIEHWETGTNYMGLIVFSISLGITLTRIGSRGRSLLDVCQGLSDCIMILINWVIWFSPVGVMFLIAGEILRIEDFGAVVKSLGLYLGTIVAGLVIHGMIVLPLLFFLLTRKLPFKYTGNMMPAMAMAFGSGSSTATLPFTMKCVEELNGVDRRVSRFLLPIGATVNMDGTALFQAVAAIFISQVVGINLTVGKIFTIGVAATAASIAAAGIPHGGFVTMVMLLNSIGLPADYLAYIVPIDWLVDRLRTPINVLGDSIGAGIINHMCKEELERLPPMHIPDDKHLLAEERGCPDCHV